MSLNNLSNRLHEKGDVAAAIQHMERAITLIEEFAKPGTPYADWHQAMVNNLGILKNEA